MKKWRFGRLAAAALCLLLCISFSSNVWASGEESEPQVSSGAVVAADLDSGAVLYEKNAGEAFAPADLTKIMTVLLLAENYDLSETVSFSEILYRTEEGSSQLGLQPGEEISLYDAACAIWLGNANDVVNGVAEYAAGSREAFAEQMNLRAQELGCQNTCFTDPNGYDSEGQYTCASDLCLILQAAYQNAAFREISGLAEYEIPATNLTESSRYLKTGLQMSLADSGTLQECLVGGMESTASGETEHLAAFCSREGRNLIVVVLGSPDVQTAASDAAFVAEYGFSQNAASGGAEDTVTSETDTEVVDLIEETADVQGSVTDSALQEDSAAQSGQDDQETQDTESRLLNFVKTWIVPILEKGSDGIQDVLEYAKGHQMQTVVIVDGVLAVVLVLLLVISFLRGVRNARIRRRRKREKRQRRIREAQIERMKLEDVEDEIDRDLKKAEEESKDRRK